MADLSCTFLDLRSLTTNYKLRLNLSCKHYYSSAPHSHNSRNSRIKRRPLHPTLLCLPSSKFDVISTHEHPDGSFLFRFGDPSEVPKIDNIEEPNNVEEEIGEESKHVTSVLNVDNKTEVMAEKADREVTASNLTELVDHSNSIVSSSKRVSIVEGESDMCENLGLNEVYEDSSALGSSLLDESSKVESSQKETVEIASTPVIDKEHVVDVEEGLEEEQEETSTANTTIRDRSPDVGHGTTELEIYEKETAQVTSMTDPDIAVPDDGVLLEGLENVVTTDAPPISDSDLVSLSPESESAMSLSKEIEEQNEMGNVAIGDSSESDMNDIEALEMQYAKANGNASDAEAKSPPMEAAIGSETQASGAESGMTNETVGYASENDAIQLVAMPPRLEADSILEEETGFEAVEESREDNGSENLKVGGDLVEALANEAPVTESPPVSQEMLTTNFVLSSGAALLPHPSKVLTGGEDAYFIAGQTWLGVADGVGLWSLEGTKPGVYAQELIKNCEKLISVDNGDSINNPIKLLNLSVSVTHSPGSSSVLIAQLDCQALNVANVGDSGFIVLRDGSVFMRSSPMHHVFYFPLQIERGDSPSSLAELYRIDLEDEDVIITATDGLLDNLYDQEIASIVMNSLAAADKNLEEIAELLAMKAQEIGNSASVRTPFSDNAQAAGFAGYSGGKLDDVAVIVSVVKTR